MNGDLGMGVAQVDVKRVACHGDRRSDVDVLGAMAVVVKDRFALVDAIGPGGDAIPRLAFGAVEDGVDGFDDRPGAVFLEQLQHTALTHPRRADHCAEVAQEVVGVANIDRDHLHDVLTDSAGVIELERGDAQTFLPDLGGVRVVGAVCRAADVALV